MLAEIGERLTGLAAFSDDRVLAAAYDTGNVWLVTPGGSVSLFASGISGANTS